MRTLSGQYQLEETVAAFFGARTVKLVARDAYVTGRFGREGVIRGSVRDHEVIAQWHDRSRKGWLRIHFAASFATGELEYGTDHTTAQPSMVVRTVRAARRRAEP
ncbi:MAG TPA: hypothetical protein VFN49_05795 [Candidatus Aquilonibacter sp.]|nr:hypothetical protein [Candidatus Aquilonibacter sp.]